MSVASGKIAEPMSRIRALSKSLLERYATLSLEAPIMDRPALRRYIESEVGKWSRLVKEYNIKAE